MKKLGSEIMVNAKQEIQFWREVGLQVEKDLGLASESIVKKDLESTRENHLSELSSIVGFMLDKDRERLVRAAYRVDLSEVEMVEVLENSGSQDLARNFAELIMSREEKKIKTRRKYSEVRQIHDNSSIK